MKLQIKRLSNDAKIPTKGSINSAGYDLYSIEEVNILPNSKVLISTGISMLPPGGELKSQSEMNAFFIIPIRKGFIGKFFKTHPPMEERIERLNELQYNF